jgi:hypothetical protein
VGIDIGLARRIKAAETKSANGNHGRVIGGVTKTLKIIGISFLATIGLVIIFGQPKTQTPTDPVAQEATAQRTAQRAESDKHFGARYVAQQLVLDNLKAPSTAKLGAIKSVISNGSYIVGGVVDSQNSYGAMLRNEWAAELVPVDACGDYNRLSCWTVKTGVAFKY